METQVALTVKVVMLEQILVVAVVDLEKQMQVTSQRVALVGQE
jgi:hypothetical protein